MTGAERYVLKCRILLPSHVPTPKDNLDRTAFPSNSIIRSLDEWTKMGLAKERFFSLVKKGRIIQCDESTLAQVLNAKGHAPPVALSPGYSDTDGPGDGKDGLPYNNDPSKVNGYDEKFLAGKTDDELRGIVWENHPNRGTEEQIAKMGRQELFDIILEPADY